MTPCCGPGNTLPITTGRVGLSQTTGEVQFYNPPHVWKANTCWTYTPCPYPGWPVPMWRCPAPGGCSCCGGGCCFSCGGCGGCGTCSCSCFTFLLTNIGPWCRFWTDQQYQAWLTGKEPWPPTADAANADLQATLPAACFPSPAAQAAIASIGVH